MASLNNGSQLGPYEIASAIGAGGMGEVYRAVDTRLGRTVAIKVLGATLAQQPESRERFEREARTISNLNHPHICTLYDVGHQDGVDYLVMEYLEGETLASALERGRIPFDDALTIAIQIGDALDKAHRQGVVHRDLKPGNVMLTKNGAKLLDFGLAKLRPSEAPVVVSATALPTDARNLTGAGTILGTLQYMSPEQLEGREADARSDLFAFGATLYEMLTGRKAFSGKTQVSLMASILEHEPPSMTSIQPILPQALESVVHGCLTKNPEERWQTARDVVRQLNWLRANPTAAGVSEVTASGSRSRTLWMSAVIAAVAFVIAAVAVIGVFFRTEPLLPVVRFDVLPPAGGTFTGEPPRFAVSPDGRYVVFAASAAGQRDQLWLRRLDSPEAKPIVGTEERPGELAPQSPFWSPNSKSIAFFVQTENGSLGSSKLKKVDIEGGPVQTLAELPSNNAGGTWSSDGVILVATQGTKGVQRIPATGGVATPITKLDTSEDAHLWPQFLPDGRHFIFQLQTPDREKWAIHVGSLDSNDHKLLIQTEYAQFAAPNFLLYVRVDALLAQPLDLKKYELMGEPLLISKSLLPSNIGNGRAAFGVSQTGVVVYASGSATAETVQLGDRQMVWADRDGKMSAPVGDPIQGGLRLAPNGKRVALSERGTAPANDIWIFDIERGIKTRLTTDVAPDGSPVWSPDGLRLVFNSNRDKKGFSIYVKPFDGATPEQPLLPTEGEFNLGPLDQSSDGKWLIFAKAKGGPRDLWVLPLSGDKKPFPYLETRFDETAASLSPNGRWLAYTSNESGTYQVIVQPFPDPSGGKWQISTNGGLFPRWKRDGKELYYMEPAARIASVSVITDGNFQVGKTVSLFDTPFGVPAAQSPGGALFPYDVSADGQRFLLSVPRGRLNSGQPRPLTVTVNWQSALN